MIKFVKQWRDISRRQRDLDYDRTQFAKELRSHFKSDDNFVKWCVEELPDMTDGQARGMLKLVPVLDVVKDVDTWHRLGGVKPIRRLVETVPVKERRAVIAKADGKGKALTTVLTERSREQEAQRVIPITSAAKPTPKASPCTTAEQDAALLAQWILKTVRRKSIPAAVLAAMSRHLSASTLRVSHEGPRAAA